jgi:hypothetical protein
MVSGMRITMRELLVMVVLSALTCFVIDSIIQASYRSMAAYHEAQENESLQLHIQFLRYGHKKQGEYMLKRAAYHDDEQRRYRGYLH